jgi:hypothetical protein
LFQTLDAQPRKSAGPGRCVMFVAARRGEGVTTIVEAAATGAPEQTTYAIDLDLRRNALARAMKQDGFGPRIDARLSGQSFYRLTEASGRPHPEYVAAYGYHRVRRSRLYVGVFDARHAPEGGRILISSAPDYWNAVRAGGALATIDAPALERSQIALKVCAHMDGVVLVVGADAGAAPAAMAARTDLLAAGANIIGLVYAKAPAPVIAIDRWMRRAG